MPIVSRLSSKHFRLPATRPAILIGIMAGFAIRLHRLGAESLWYDETVSAYLAGQPIPDLIAHTARDIHPPAYYILLHAWRSLADPSIGRGFEFLLAFPSLWFGVLSLSLLVPLARMLVGEQGAAPALWLAAISPFLVWYSQEVRMYMVAAALGLVCLYAAIKFFTPSDLEAENYPPITHSSWRWLGLYILSAAASLYTLYYAAFALIAINLAAFVAASTHRPVSSVSSRLKVWFVGQFAVLLLFLPWLPCAIRQVVEPPVPAWRARWPNLSSATTDLAQSLAALLVGQSVPSSHVWAWAIVVGLLVAAYYRYAKSDGLYAPHAAVWLTSYLFVPLAVIVLISVIVSPIFHVRYLAIYAPAFSLIAAGALLYIHKHNTTLAVLAACIVAIGSLYSVTRFWTHPDYRADDHRGAVQRLAAAWRPGDVSLVNAGWVYTAVDTYWPRDLDGPDAALPAPLTERIRLPDASQAQGAAGVVPLLVTGSIDGPSSLGWAMPESDFFPMSEADAAGALAALNDRGQRIWHYRLYDTVSDPEGSLRAWLTAHMRLVDSQPFSGRDYLRLELYDPSAQPTGNLSEAPPLAIYEEALSLLDALAPSSSQAGAYLYVPVTFYVGPDGELPNAPLAASLRLADQSGALWAQHDQRLASVPDRLAGTIAVETLALPVPASTPPGYYALELVIYRQDTLAPLAAYVPGGASGGVADTHGPEHSLNLGHTRIELPTSMPRVDRRPLAVFDYLELIRGKILAESVAPGHSITLDLVWRPRPNPYADNYAARIALTNARGDMITSWSHSLGGDNYLSGGWPAGYAVRDLVPLEIAQDLPAGVYTLSLSVERIADGLHIPATSSWLPISRPSVELGEITVEPSPH